MSWEFDPVFDAAQRAALENRKALVCTCVPAPWPLRGLLAHLPPPAGDGVDTVILVPTTADARDAAAAIGRVAGWEGVHAVTGTGRAERLVRAGAVDTLVATPTDALYLVQRSALKAHAPKTILLAWPETMSDMGNADAMLAGAPDAQRIIVTADPAAVSSLLERHAHRAPRADLGPAPAEPAGRARYAVVTTPNRVETVRGIIDQLSPARTVVWDPSREHDWAPLLAMPDVALVGDDPDAEPADLAIAVDLPTAPAWDALQASAKEVAIVIGPGQLAALRRTVAALVPLRLETAVDRLRSDAAGLREDLRRRLAGVDLATGLRAIEPLLDEYDPVLLAAAALAGRAPDLEPPPPPTAWKRLFISAGRRDQVGAPDLVGALRRTANLEPTDIGRVDVREQFSLVDIRPERVEHAIRALDGQKIRDRRVTVRLDRPKPGKGRVS